MWGPPQILPHSAKFLPQSYSISVFDSKNVNICCCSCLFLYKLRVSIVLLSGFPHTNVSFIFDIYYDNISTFTIYARMSNLPRNGGHTLFFPLRIYSNMMSLSLRSFFTPFHPVIEFECLKVAASG